MNKFYLIIIGLLLFTGCSKNGCLDPDAINYNPHAKSDPSTCEYTGNQGVVITTGDINIPTIWKNLNNDIDYHINHEVTIYDTLIIEAGVRIKFGPNGSLELYRGLLDMQGTADNGVILESEVSGVDWDGIDMKNSYEDTHLVMSHVLMKDAAIHSFALRLDAPNVQINDLIIRVH